MDMIEQDGSIFLTVRVTPRSSRSEIVGEHDGMLKVKLQAPPVGGAANEKLVKLLAKKLDVSRSAIAIVGGETARTKRLKVSGVSAEEIRSVLS